jgi:hypothetical protein
VEVPVVQSIVICVLFDLEESKVGSAGVLGSLAIATYSKSESSLSPIAFSATYLNVYINPLVTVIVPNTSPTFIVYVNELPSYVVTS